MHRFATGLVGVLTVLATLSAQGSSNEEPIRDLVAAWRAGDPHAWSELERRPERAARALLDEIAERVHEPPHGATVELRALGDLKCATAEILDELLAMVEEAPEGQAGLILRTIGDLVPYAEDVEELQRWVEEHRPSRNIERIAAVLEKQIGEFRTAPTEYGRLAKRLRLRHVEGLGGWLERLRSEDFDVCELAAERLAEFGEPAKAAVPRLAELVAHPEPSALVSWKMHAPDGYWASDLPHLGSQVRIVAAEAILAIAPGSAEAFAAHMFLLEHGEARQKLASVVALRERVDDPDRLTAALVPWIRQSANRALRREAMLTLATLGPEAREAIPTLEALIGRGDPELRATARATLRAVEANR